MSSQSLEDDFLDDLLAVQLDFGFDFGAASQGTPSDSLDMVQLGFIRIVSSLGCGCRTNPSQGSGRQLLPRAFIPRSLPAQHFIFEAMRLIVGPDIAVWCGCLFVYPRSNRLCRPMLVTFTLLPGMVPVFRH